MKMQSIEDLLYTGLTYVHDFEQQVSKEAEKMAEASSDSELKDLFSKSAKKSSQYAERIQKTFQSIGKEPKSNDNHIAKAMIDEVENMIQNTDPSPVRDAALIAAANQQQLYRVAAYGSLKTYAELMGKREAATELDGNLEDSKGGDAKLTELAENQVNAKAAEQQPAAA